MLFGGIMSNDNNKKVNNSDGKSKNTAKKVLTVIAVLMIIAGLCCFGYYIYMQKSADGEDDKAQSYTQSTTAAQTDGDKVKNPIDFKSLQSKNSDIYAWIKVDGTKVDHPVCQSPTDDYFYLRHSAYDKSYVSSGAIYTELSNTTTFKDRVTVIYGHNNYGDSMFTTLHKFESKEFFDSHPYFYIYTPTSQLKYQIVSAFKYDDRHIMNSFNFQNNGTFEEFIKMIKNPQSTNKNVRSKLDKDITIDDNIVVLSTCVTNQKSNRYLVCGVLIDDEKTY